MSRQRGNNSEWEEAKKIMKEKSKDIDNKLKQLPNCALSKDFQWNKN